MNPLHKADNEPDATSMGASMRPGSAAASPAIPQAGTEEHTRRQIIWDKKMQNSTESRRHYEKTAVLLVAFEDTDLKDLDKEVDSLGQVFEDSYGFHVDKRLIKSTGNSQWDLIASLSTFFRDHDSEQTLLIVYYAGHGWAPPSKHKEFKIHGRSNVAKSRMNCVEWHEAENMLTSVKGDVFAIFDCCNAGRLCHTRGPALWEVLGACSEDQTTQPPGHDSFTQALIWALKELRQKPNGRFSTSELRRKIKEAPFLPRNQQPPLKNRTNDSLPHIVIAPCSKADKVDNLVTPISSEENQVEVAQYFDIRLHATVVTDELIEKTAEVLNELMSPNSESPMPIDRISFLGSGSFNRVHRFALSWLEKTRVKNSRSASEQPQKTKKKALSCPTLHIPAQTTAHTNLEVPPHSATSDKSVSSNATTCDEGLQEANPPLIFAEPTSIYKSSDHGVSIDVNTATIPATAVIESSASDRDLELDNDVATSTSKLQTSTRPPRHEQNKDQDNREKGNLAAAKRSSNFRQAGSISSFLKSKVLRIKTQDT